MNSISRGRFRLTRSNVCTLSFFILFLGCIITATGCNSDTQGGSKTPTVAAVENCNRALNGALRFKDSTVQKAFSNPIQLELAKEYIANFTDSAASKPVRDAMGTDLCASYAFDSSVLSRFAHMYNTGDIDGFRLYLARYDKNVNDVQAFNRKDFTLILVGTKINKSSNLYRDTLVPVAPGAKIYYSLEDYSNPCKPLCPQAAVLSTLQHTK